MSDARLVLAIFLAASTSCGPGTPDDPASTSSSDASNTSSPTATAGATSTDATTDGETSSSSDSGGDSSSCEGWKPPLPPYPWSYQDCLTDPCPDGEVCRYDPNDECGAHPVCVDPTTLACHCEQAPDGGFACSCPGPDGISHKVVLECNTGMAMEPVSYDVMCGV
jgi:hypothetical protein